MENNEYDIKKQFKIIDSNEFHLSKQSEAAFKFKQIKLYLSNVLSIKRILILLLWIVLFNMSQHYGLVTIFLTLSGFAIIFCNLG